MCTCTPQFFTPQPAASFAVVLITDASAATGSGDGDYEFGARSMRVTKGVARLPDSGVLAGSLLTLDAALRYAVQIAGIDLVEAIASITRTPADLLGRPQLGRLEEGSPADLVVLDDQLQVLKVMRNGHWCG